MIPAIVILTRRALAHSPVIPVNGTLDDPAGNPFTDDVGNVFTY